MIIMEHIQQLNEILSSHANQEKAEGMSAYMRHQFDFWGIPSPLRKEITANWRKEILHLESNLVIAICQSLWQLPQREFQYVAMDILQVFIKKANIEFAPYIEWFITSKAWWDTVDFLSVHIAGKYLQLYPGQQSVLLNNWNLHPSFWMNRCAIIFQLKYKNAIQDEWLRTCCLTHQSSQEFFIQKALGWMLREYAKTNPQAVIAILDSIELKPLTVREATKHMKSRL